MITHLARPKHQRTECMRLLDRAHVTDVIGQVTCKVCLRRYLQRLALMRALKIAKEHVTP